MQQHQQRASQQPAPRLPNAPVAETEDFKTEHGIRRETRQPFGSQTQKLAYPKREGYHHHWFNDTPGRVDQALQAGYVHVKDKTGKNVSRVVGTQDGGGGLTAFLMEIPQEWYDEDMAREEERNFATEAAIKRGDLVGAPGMDNAERFYPGTKSGQKITISR